MIDAVKEYLAWNTFGTVAYVCVIVHLLLGSVLIAVTVGIRGSENGRFSCAVDPKRSATYKKQVDQSCFSRYDQIYNSPVPLYGFVLLSIVSTLVVSVVYSLIVRNRVDEIKSSLEQQQQAGNLHGHDRRTVYVFYGYFSHLVLRALLGIMFTVLQYLYFYRNGFDLEYSCNIPPKSTLNNVSVVCENASASEKRKSGVLVAVLNSFIALVVLIEVIYLGCHCLPSQVSWATDSEFVTDHLLNKRYVPLGLFRNKDCLDSYKRNILIRPLSHDIFYGVKGTLDDLYIDVLIHTERARHYFSRNMERHEMYDVYMKVPSTSIRLKNIKDLFLPNYDTKGNFPRNILVIGRPGIGKTVLTEKILCDWANQVDTYYGDKIVFFFKLRWFNGNNEKMNLKTFLCLGMGCLSDKEFESIYDTIRKEPNKAILIFDGLDEFHGNYNECFDESKMISNDPDTSMSVMNLFIKLVSGGLLEGAMPMVTGRPTADDFYSRLHFDRKVEIIGFTPDKIKDYVSVFCKNGNRIDFEPKIWNHIESSSELLNLCYIPVNCSIICTTLSECLSDPTNDTGTLPSTLTELYKTATNHYEEHHHKGDKSTAKDVVKKLGELAFNGMKKGQLVFEQELFDEQMQKSGLLNSLSNPIFRLQKQFCFIHLTIQEFLAAEHVIETYSTTEIKKFISDHLENGKWHLVFQFIAGLLGKKMKMFDVECKSCIWAFTDHFEVADGERVPDDKQLLIMKCIREVNDEEIAEEVCETTALKNVFWLRIDQNIPPSDLAAIAFVCKHMKNFQNLELYDPDSRLSDKCQEIQELVQKRCLHQLVIRADSTMVKAVLNALLESNCKLNHNHTKLISLAIVVIAACGRYYDKLEISKLCEVLNNECCTELKQLKLSGIKEHDVDVLCDTLTKGPSKLTTLDLSSYPLTDQGISPIVKFLQDERCQLTSLSLSENVIGDKGGSMLFKDALTSEFCKLTHLDLSGCHLTDQCMPDLCKALKDERCQLAFLSLKDNKIGDEGASMLFKDALTSEFCKLTHLNLNDCQLTSQCMPDLFKALKDERCRLTSLRLDGCKMSEKDVFTLFEDVLVSEHCKLAMLELNDIPFTTQCMSSLCKALQDERCQLTDLSLGHYTITEEVACMLFTDAITKEHCKLTLLILYGCKMTDKCIPILRTALQHERCRLTRLHVGGVLFSEQGRRAVLDVMNHESCKARDLQIFVHI